MESYSYPHFFQSTSGIDAATETVDLIFIDYIASDILAYLDATAGVGVYTEDDVAYYIDETFSTQTYLPLFVQTSALFQQNLDNCTIY